MISDKPKVFMKAAAGIVMKEGENGETMILLIQRSADDHWPLHWEFPRGKCDKPVGEDIIKCLKREVKEETGLDVTPIKYIDKFTYLADRGERQTTCYNFLCRMLNPDQKIRLSKEHSDYKFILEVGQAGMLVMPDQRKIIEKALNIGRSITMDPDNNFSDNDVVDEHLENLKEWVTVYSSATTDYQISNRTAIALGVLLAWAVAGAFSAYRSKASGAVDACKSSKGEAKTKCIEKFKNAGRKKQIEMLQKAKSYCVKTPNPQKCSDKLDEKISKVKSKMK